MPLKILKTKKEYQKSLERFEDIFQAKAGTPQSDEADVLALLIKDYEDKHYVIGAPSPIEAIKYRMEQQGLTNKDLAQILGFKSRVSDIFKKESEIKSRYGSKAIQRITYSSGDFGKGILKRGTRKFTPIHTLSSSKDYYFRISMAFFRL